MMASEIEAPTAFRCCGIRIDAIPIDNAVNRLCTVSGANTGYAVHLCNAWTLALARRDPSLSAALNRGDLNLPDGTPLTWIGRRIGFSNMKRRVYGPDLMLATMRAGRRQGLRHYLYGSTPEVIEALQRRLIELVPGVNIVGGESPPFRALSAKEDGELIERLRQFQPDMVWVGLGTPHQDLFVDHFRYSLDATLVAVGAAFDFISGSKSQAPTWMQDRGLEWLFRLATEPRRLWRRYLIGNALFLAGVARGVDVCPEHSEDRT
jgi:N-acetylglucosaminyldiphosphoundecaprenol N-acetyl-beta-D-mannosaminyltransferase